MSPLQLFELIIGMFVAVLVLQYMALRLRLPPAVALLVGGGGLAFVPGLPEIRLNPELVLVVFLPPLLMDGPGSPPLRLSADTWLGSPRSRSGRCSSRRSSLRSLRR